MERGAVLARTRLFAGVPPESIAELASAARMRIYKRGTFLFREGDPGNAMYVLVAGQVKIGRIGSRGDEVIFGMVKPGETFGELAVFEREPARKADAEAIETSECLILPKGALLPFLEKHPSTMLKVIQVLIGYLLETDMTLSEAAFLDIPGRVAKKLLELGTSQGDKVEDGVRIRVRMTQRMLASMIGASRENVNRAVSRFERQGLIRQDSGHITLMQLDRLRRMC